MTRLLRAVVAVAASLVLGSSLTATVLAPAAAADPGAARGSLSGIDRLDDRRWDVHVFSPSMDKVITLQVLRPADTSVARPTLYMLNGAGGGEDGANWLRQTDIAEFFHDKNVNVVIPVGGQKSYYTDWERDDPTLGRNKWLTFLTHELPPVLDEALGANGVNAIGGLSMSAGSVLDLAIQAPGLYRGVASYSGCAQTSNPLARQIVRGVVEGRGGGDAVNMWGTDDDPRWSEHDPTLNAEGLRGLELYISSANGLPGPYEMPGAVRPVNSPPLPDQIVVGGVIEAVTNTCTLILRHRLDQLGIPAHFDLGAPGTHSWGYWQDALRTSWPTLERALFP